MKYDLGQTKFYFCLNSKTVKRIALLSCELKGEGDYVYNHQFYDWQIYDTFEEATAASIDYITREYEEKVEQLRSATEADINLTAPTRTYDGLL